MKQKLEQMKMEALRKIQNVESPLELKDIRIAYLGKKGALKQILRGMGHLDKAVRPVIGKLANEAQQEIERMMTEKLSTLESKLRETKLEEETVDVTLPGIKPNLGHQHPLNLIYNEMIDIFIGMGFEVLEGREIESDYYNFEALNMPKNHPARDMQDTFYISEDIVLRTHTSPMQIHTMEGREPNQPVKMVCPGRVYRRDDDATHSPMFHQIEGLIVDKGISMAHLKGTLEAFFQQMFFKDIAVRLRPSYFPFTEPSAEVDITCVFCKGKGCSVCKQTGWIEVLGAGMVHPNVLRNVGYDPDVVTGLAFGMGIDRIAMLKLGINDLRYFFTNDMRIIEQF